MNVTRHLRYHIGAALCLTLFFAPVLAAAGELIYTPVNPSFGGNAFNASHLQFLATTQRQFEQHSPQPQRDSTEIFAEQIKSRLLSRVSSDIADRILDPDSTPPDEPFEVGDTQINYSRDVNGDVQIFITDVGLNSTTTVKIPADQLNVQ